jgi:hypothetical protein
MNGLKMSEMEKQSANFAHNVLQPYFSAGENSTEQH